MRRALVALLALPLLAASTPGGPLLPSGPDPWVTQTGGWYYYMGTEGDRLSIRRTRDLARLSQAPAVTVWRAPAIGPNSGSIWAPELHRIDGRWFLYYSAVDKDHDDDAHRGVFVLENDRDDPLAGRWIDRGRVNTARAGIDGTTFTIAGRRYFAYSPYVGADSVIAIARMANPWTLEGEETILARPDQAWERQGGRQILEGPAFLQRPGGDLFLAYSGSACWSDGYAVGLLRARRGSDPMAAASWTKLPGPALASSANEGIFAPGHNGFYRAGGKDWIVFHANPAAKMGCTQKRAPHVRAVRWTRDGTPVLQ